MQEIIIELLNPKTAQLSDWQFREAVVEKINEIINLVNKISGSVIDEEENLKRRQEESDKEAEEERIAKERADEEERIRKEKEDEQGK